MVATVRNLTSSSATSEYFRQDGGYYLADREDAADLRAKRAEHRNASAWHGTGAAALGLHPGNPVGARAFERLLQGHVIGTRQRLGRLRDGQHEHRPGFDITFSAPKSVSLAALLPTEENPHGDRAVISAHNAAVRETLDWIEGTLLETRGWDPVTRRRPRVKAPCMVAALFRHIASRNLDPQLHTHAVIANMTRDGEGRWKSVEPTLLHRNARLIGAYYRDRLARQLIAKGYSILPAMVGRLPSFELAGYGRELREAFSTRRHEILAYVDGRGWDRGAAAMQAATLATRKRKAEPVKSRLQQLWQDRAQAKGLDTAPAVARSREPIVLPEGPSALKIVRRCMRQLEERQSVFPEHALEALALGHSPGLHSIGDIRDAVAWMVRDGHLVEAELRRADRAFVTDRALKAERSTIALMKAGIGAGEALVRGKDVAVHLEGAGLTEGQEEAVRTILLARDRIVGVQGRAGTGKTTMLRQVAELAGGRPVIGLAPSTAAAAVLGRETGIHARTLQWFLARCRAAGMKGEALERLKEIFGGAVLVLDEASMVSTEQMRSLLRAADRLDVARVVLVGDTGQLRAVEAGQPFRLLQRAGMTTALMDDILRQRNPELRAAVQAVLAGDPGEAVALLGSSVHEVAHEELAETAAWTWLALDPAARDETLLVAPTHALREEINRTVRDTLADEKVLRGKPLRIERLVSLGLTRAEKGDRRNYREGDLVVFNQDLINYRLKRDEVLTVTGFDYDRVMLLHPDGKPRWIKPTGRSRYLLDVYETRPLEIRAGDRIRWTRNDRKRSLVNGERAEVEGIGKDRVRFRLSDGRGLSLRLDDPQLRHIDHAWSSTVHGAQGSTAEGVIAVLDSSHGALTDQSTFYVEISRARERAVVLTDNAEELVKVLAENTGERPTAIEAIDAPLDLEPEKIVRLLAEEEPVWTPREDWEALERRARREGTVLFLVEGYGALIADAEQLAENPDLPAVTREVVDGLMAYDRACREGDRAAVEFLGLLDAHDAGRREFDEAAEKTECPVAGLEDYPEWREMSGRLSANGEALLAALGERAGEAGSGISRRLGALADLLAVDDAVLEFDTLRRAVAAQAAAEKTIPFYAEGHDALVERATNLARRSPLPAWALAVAREVLAHAEACKERRAAIVALHDDAVGLLDERSDLEKRAREAGGSKFTPPTELEGYAGWLARCGEVGERWRAIRRAMREDTRAWRPHLDRLKNEAGKIAAAVERFDRLGEHDPAWKQVFETRLTMAKREKAGSVISFYQQGWEELVEEARAFGRRKGLPDQARALVKRVLGYDRRLGRERATVDGFLEDAEKHWQRRDPLEEEARHRVQQDPDFLVTDLPGYRTIPRVPDKLLATGRAIREKEDTYGPHLDQVPDGRQKLADALEWMERHHLLDRFVSVMDRIEKTKRSLQERGVSLAGDEGYDGAIAKAERLAKEPDLEEEARRRLRAAIAEHASLAIEWREIESLFREAEALDTRYRQLVERAAREDVPRSMLTEWQALQERSHRFEKAAHWALMDDRIQDYRQRRPDTFQGIEEGLRLARERRDIPDLEDARIAAMVGAELARLRDPGVEHAFTRSWAAQEPLLAGDRIRLQLTDDGPQPEAVVRQPGWTGGRTRHDMVELEWVSVPQGGKSEQLDARMSGPKLAGRVHRAEWSDERLREVERARQFPAPPAKFPFASAKGVTRGDVLCRIEVAALDPAAPESSRPGRPAVVRIEMEVVEITAAKTEGEDQCRLRERWRSDDEPCREFSLLLGHLSAFARARAFWNSSEDERWSKAHAQKMELDERRIVLNQPGPHYSWSRTRP